jgi:nicotinamide-nucleotide amidase
MKAAELGVDEETLRTHGAVSPESAAAMSRGVRERLRADVAIAVTGIAGPGGGTPEKPVGLVYLNASGPRVERARELHLHGGRDEIRRRATVTGLHLLRGLLEQPDDVTLSEHGRDEAV